MERLVRLKILAASVALREFTIPELVAYSGANENTVRSVVHRDSKLFEPAPGKVGEAASRWSGDETSLVNQLRSRARGRPATRWRVVDPEQIRQLVADLQGELAEAQQETIRPAQRTEKNAHISRLAAMKVAEGAVLRAWEERDPELRRVLSRTAFNNLAKASPPSASDEAAPERLWWDASLTDSSAPGGSDEEALRWHARGIAMLARVIDAEAKGSILGTDELAGAMVAVSRLDAVPSEPQVQAFFEQLMDSALRTRITVGRANVFGKLVKAKSPVSVNDLFSGTGLPHHEVDRLVQRLLDHKYVVPYYEENSPAPERPISALRVNEEEHRAIGVSILPNEVIGVLTSLQVSESKSTLMRRNFGMTGQGPIDVDVVVHAVSSLVQAFERVRTDIIGLGVELPGHVGRMGEVVYSPILRQRNVLLEERLQRATGLRTVVENDANALAVHEQYFGDGTDTADFVVILLSERGGVGSGLISNYRVLYGSKGAAGELGHIEFKPGGVECDCGKFGCLETIAGVAGILRELNSIKRPAANLAAAAELAEEDEAVRRVFESAGQALGWGITTVLNLLDPERIILFAPEELVNDQRYVAARRFTHAVQETARERAFSTTAQFKQVMRPLPYKPVWRPLPQEERVAASAASAVLSHFIPQAHDWDPVPSSGPAKELVAIGSAGRSATAGAHEI
jgi:predicted NBD/HSP70 family sugar kinase